MLWQEQLERVLSPKTAQADREILLRDLLGRGPEIVDEVIDALEQQDLESLVPPESETQRTLQEIQAVQDQVLEEAMAQANEAQVRLSDPERLASDVAQAAQDAPPVLAQAAGSAASVLTSLLSDPAKAAALAQQEARNVVSRTPEGAEMPPYSVVLTAPSFEVRRYQPCSVAAVDIASAGSGALGSGLGPFGGGGALSGGALAAYNALVAYFVGANSDAAAMELTSPVRLDPPLGRRCRQANALHDAAEPLHVRRAPRPEARAAAPPAAAARSTWRCGRRQRRRSRSSGSQASRPTVRSSAACAVWRTRFVRRAASTSPRRPAAAAARRRVRALRGGGRGDPPAVQSAVYAALLAEDERGRPARRAHRGFRRAAAVVASGVVGGGRGLVRRAGADVAESAAPATPADDAAASDAPGADVEEEVAEYDEDDSAPSDC